MDHRRYGDSPDETCELHAAVTLNRPRLTRGGLCLPRAVPACTSARCKRAGPRFDMHTRACATADVLPPALGAHDMHSWVPGTGRALRIRLRVAWELKPSTNRRIARPRTCASNWPIPIRPRPFEPRALQPAARALELAPGGGDSRFGTGAASNSALEQYAFPYVKLGPGGSSNLAPEHNAKFKRSSVGSYPCWFTRCA